MDSSKKWTLSWDAYGQNICSGFGLLQQRGEFVDMTLAADGHHVKVHQMVLSLVSPFFKELIMSANCPHPVIYLNKVSYKTLLSLLEYVYTGEAMVPADELSSFLEICRDLDIKGLENIKIKGSGNKLLQLITAKNTLDPKKLLEPSQEEKQSHTESKKRKVTEIEEYTDNDENDEFATEYIVCDDEILYDVEDTNVEMDEDNNKTHDDNETFYDDETGANDKTCDDEAHYDGMDNDKKPDIRDLQDNRKEDVFMEIVPYKAGSRWVARDGYYYVVQRVKGQTTYFRCGSDKCPAHWKLYEKKGPGPIVNDHNHQRTPWVPNRNAMFQALRLRTTSESLPLHNIYEEEAARYQDAAPHLPYESVVPSMRKWRRSSKLEQFRGFSQSINK